MFNLYHWVRDHYPDHPEDLLQVLDWAEERGLLRELHDMAAAEAGDCLDCCQCDGWGDRCQACRLYHLFHHLMVQAWLRIQLAASLEETPQV